jgi:glycosyltransferase involved in cell wall biosynthesis
LRFSVIIPAYNSERYIAQAIESCLNQTYPPHEIIVVDDASADGTVTVAESFPAPVRIIRLPENMGAAVARIRGVQASTGDWIAFLDADDWYLPEKLELQRRCALENEQAVLIYTCFLTSLDGVERPARLNPPAKLWPMLRCRCAIHLSTVALRRDAFDSVGGFDTCLRCCQDWDLWLRLVVRYSVGSFAIVPKPLAVYRITPGSLSSNAIRYFTVRTSMVEIRCLYGTAGVSRYFWRRKILAFMYYDTSIALREEGSLLDLQFIFRSIALWPFLWKEMPMMRYKVAAVMVKQHQFKRLSKLAIRA